MSFSQRHFERSTYQTRGIFNTYVYETQDSSNEVLSDGYFLPCRFYGEDGWTGGTIDINCQDSNFIVEIGDGTLRVKSSYNSEVKVISPHQLQNIDSTKMYVIDGIIDFTGTGLNIEIPSGGFSYRGTGIEVSGLICSDDNYTLFTSPVGGSGTIFGSSCYVTIDGANSKVNDLTDTTGFNAFEFDSVNWVDCTSLGEINGYRQGLEVGTGRLGGTPELTMSGTWAGGYRTSTSIAFNMDDMANGLFVAGTGLTIGGRFITDINCNLPASGALLDFSPVNINNEESLILDGCYITREGVLDAGDNTIYPNIDQTSIKSNWGGNTGIPNTQKYIKAKCSAEVETTISAISTYYPLLGVFSVDNQVQFDMPANGEFELLTGNGLYRIIGNVQIKGTNGDAVDLRVTLSDDGGSTFPTEINHIQLEIPNLAGSNDFATYSVNFVQSIKKGQRIRMEVRNTSSTNNLTMKQESFLTVSEV